MPTALRYKYAILFAAIFAVLATAITCGLMVPFDLAVRGAVHAVSTRELTDVAQGLSFIGSNPVWVTLFLLMSAGLWLSGRRVDSIALVAAMGGGVALENGLKLAFHRARPEVFFGVDPWTFSFPSGHALFATCFYGSLALVATGFFHSARARALCWAVALTLVISIGWSRVYLGVHYPSDVLAGYAAGAAWLSALSAAGAFSTLQS